MTSEADNKPKLGVSSCLLGFQVRHDGGHKHDGYLTGTLGKFFEFVPVCPEAEIGLGTPRESLHLEGDPEDIRVRGNKTPGLDVTDLLRELGNKMGHQLSDLSGYILKSRSPSCGMERVARRPRVDQPGVRDGVGQYATTFMKTQPLLPIEEEGRLNDPQLRENFFERVFVYHRWRQCNTVGVTAHVLINFHASHKLLILSHGSDLLRNLGQLVAGVNKKSIEETSQAYITTLMRTIRRPAARKGHTNVLQHMQGYLKKQIGQADRAELVEVIESYRLGRVPLVVPLTLLRHHFRRYPNSYIEQQVYLNPHPPELMLRNLI